MPSFERPGDDPDIWYERRGEGPTIVLLNGMSQSTANWMSQTRVLSETYDVITYDARGQGRTPVGDVATSLDVHASDLDALLEHLEVERPALVGFSHGARVALAFAARFPRRPAALVLSSAGAGDDALRDTMIRAWAEILRLGGVEAMAWCAIPDILGRDFLAKHRGQLEAMVRATVQRNSAEGLGRLLEGLQGYGDAAEDAAKVLCPTLVLSADQDRLVSAGGARTLAASLTAASLVEQRVLAECGHTAPIEQPEAWRDEVTAFLSRAA